MTTGAEALVRGLAAAGVTEAFGIAGGKMTPLLQALAADGRLRWTGVRHEASAAIMAAGHAALTGQVALALGEMGPGTLNLLAGAGVAAGNHWPALLLTTNQHRRAAYPHRGMFMDLDTHALMAPLVKWSAVVNDPARLPELLHTALRHALSGVPGPVHLDLPHDVLTADTGLADAVVDAPPAQWMARGRPRQIGRAHV